MEAVLDLITLTALRSHLKALTDDDAIKLIQAWRRMECDNAHLVDWCDVLTGCTGSNTAPYLLGAGQSAATTLFYLVKYLSKESGDIYVALKHIDEYASRAADAGTPQRIAQHVSHVLQRKPN